MENRIFVLLFA